MCGSSKILQNRLFLTKPYKKQRRQLAGCWISHKPDFFIENVDSDSCRNKIKKLYYHEQKKSSELAIKRTIGRTIILSEVNIDETSMNQSVE